MKRFISILCAVAVMSVFCMTSFAADSNSYICFEVVSSDENELIVDLCVLDAAEHGIKKFGVYLDYSPNAIFLGCEFTKDIGTGAQDDFTMSGVPYLILWEFDDDAMTNEKIAVARLTFLTAEPISESDVNLALSIDLENFPSNAAGETIDEGLVVRGIKIEGGVIPTPPYLVSPTVRVAGDANESGAVTLSDVSLMLQYIAKWDVTLNKDNADVTGDDSVNLSDVSLVLKYIAKWDVELK